MARPMLRTTAGLIALLLLLGSAVYVAVRWRRAPMAFRALASVGSICFVAGLLAGISFFAGPRYATPKGASASMAPSTPFAASGSVPALEVGRAIVETDEKHAKDPMWISSASAAEICNAGGSVIANSRQCRVAYLARHALGKDLNRGPQEGALPLSDVQDFCHSGAIDKGLEVCQRAYAARHATMR